MMSYYDEQEAKRRRNNILFTASLMMVSGAIGFFLGEYSGAHHIEFSAVGEKLMAFKIF